MNNGKQSEQLLKVLGGHSGLLRISLFSHVISHMNLSKLFKDEKFEFLDLHNQIILVFLHYIENNHK